MLLSISSRSGTSHFL